MGEPILKLLQNIYKFLENKWICPLQNANEGKRAYRIRLKIRLIKFYIVSNILSMFLEYMHAQKTLIKKVKILFF